MSTLFQELQAQGWKVSTVTSVPFNHALLAALYAQDVYRDDYQDLARAMLRLSGTIQQVRYVSPLPGLNVIIGTGFGVMTNPKSLASQGRNGMLGSLFITNADRTAIDVNHSGKYVVAHTALGASARQLLKQAATLAVRRLARLFGFFGRHGLDYLPYQTINNRYDPTPSLGTNGEPHPAQFYTPVDLVEQPTMV